MYKNVTLNTRKMAIFTARCATDDAIIIATIASRPTLILSVRQRQNLKFQSGCRQNYGQLSFFLFNLINKLSLFEYILN